MDDREELLKAEFVLAREEEGFGEVGGGSVELVEELGEEGCAEVWVLGLKGTNDHVCAESDELRVFGDLECADLVEDLLDPDVTLG